MSNRKLPKLTNRYVYKTIDIEFAPGEKTVTSPFNGYDEIRFNYIMIPTTFYNISLDLLFNGVPVIINGFFDIPNLVNQILTLITAISLTFTITYDPYSGKLTLTDVLPFTLQFNDQRTADTLGFSNLAYGPGLIFSTENLFNVSPINKLYVKVDGIELRLNTTVISGGNVVFTSNFGFDVSAAPFQSFLSSSQKLKEKIYMDDFVNYEFTNTVCTFTILDKYKSEIDFNGQKPILNLTLRNQVF